MKFFPDRDERMSKVFLKGGRRQPYHGDMVEFADAADLDFRRYAGPYTQAWHSSENRNVS